MSHVLSFAFALDFAIPAAVVCLIMRSLLLMCLAQLAGSQVSSKAVLGGGVHVLEKFHIRKMKEARATISNVVSVSWRKAGQKIKANGMA
jgi:hypothetical protein